MFVHEQFAVRQVGVELGDVGLGIGDIRGAAEMVGVVEEDVLGMGGVGRHVAVTRLYVVGVFGLVPLHRRAGRRAGYGVALGALNPTVGHAVVAQLLDDGVVALVRVLGLGSRALHRGHTRWRAQLAVVVLALFFYLHHTHLVVFLPGRDDVSAVFEYANCISKIFILALMVRYIEKEQIYILSFALRTIAVKLLQQVFSRPAYGNNRICCRYYHIVHSNIALFSILHYINPF